MNLILLKLRRINRICGLIPWPYRILIFIISSVIGFIIYNQLTKYPNNIIITIIYAWILFTYHQSRKDKEFLKSLYQNLHLLYFIEYLFFSIPFLILVIISYNIVLIPVVLALISIVIFLPEMHQVSISKIRYDIIFTNSYEWISGCRTSIIYLIFFYSLSIIVVLNTYLAILVYLFILLQCSNFYRECESASLLFLPGKNSLSYISYKIRTSIINFHTLSLPFYILTIFLHPDFWWLLVLLSVSAILCLVFCICLKYASYVPDKKNAGNNIISMIGIISSIIPFTYPLAIILTVRYLISANKKLKVYLDD
jgi:hypothetical protein